MAPLSTGGRGHWAAARMVLRRWSQLVSSFLAPAPDSEVDAHVGDGWCLSGWHVRMTRAAAWVEDQTPRDAKPLEVKDLRWRGRGNPLESVPREARNAPRLLPGSVAGSPSPHNAQTSAPGGGFAGQSRGTAGSIGRAGLCMLGSGMLCRRLDPTDAACPGAGDGPSDSDPRWPSGDKMGPGHGCGEANDWRQAGGWKSPGGICSTDQELST